MDRNLFVCYSRDDYEFVASFELEFRDFFKDTNSLYPENFKIHLKIDRSSSVTRLGDEFKKNLEQAIEESDGALIFISKNTALSDFINEIEIPKILEMKTKKPNYLIVPIFIDDADVVDSTILSFHAPNSQNSPLRDMPGDMKSFAYKSLINELVQSFIEIKKSAEKKAEEEILRKEEEANYKITGHYESNVEREDRELAESRKVDNTISETSSSESKELGKKRKIGFSLIFIGGLVYSLLVPSEEIQPTTSSTITSCDTFEYHYEDLAGIYDDQVIQQYEKSNEIWGNFIEIINQDSEDYWGLDSSGQKDLHQEIQLQDIPYTLSILEESLIKFQSEGLGDIAEEHVEMKKELNIAENLLISLIETRIEILSTQIEYIILVENYFEDWDTANTQEARDDAEERFLQLDQQNTERFSELYKSFSNLDDEFGLAKKTYFNTYETICVDANI